MISSYACDHMTADAEFLLSKAKYRAVTGREQRRDADVLCYQIRQAFQARRDYARRRPIASATKRPCAGRRASTPFSLPPTQTASISTTTFTTIPLRWIVPGSSGTSSGSACAVRRLSDRVCLENDLSVIHQSEATQQGPLSPLWAVAGSKRQPSATTAGCGCAIIDALAQKAPPTLPTFLRLMEESGFAVKHGRGGVISFLAPGQDKCNPAPGIHPWGQAYDPEDIRAGDCREATCPGDPRSDGPAPPRRVNLIVDIQERMRTRQGPGLCAVGQSLQPQTDGRRAPVSPGAQAHRL